MEDSFNVTFVSMTVTTILLVLAILFFTFKIMIPFIIFSRKLRPDEIKSLQDAMGPKIRELRCSGSIGMCNFGGNLIRLTLYRDGIQADPIFVPSICIPKSQITKVSIIKFFIFERIRVDHSSHYVRWPLFFYFPGRESQARNIILSMDPAASGERNDGLYYSE